MTTVEPNHHYSVKEFRAAAANFENAGNLKSAHMLNQAAENLESLLEIAAMATRRLVLLTKEGTPE